MFQRLLCALFAIASGLSFGTGVSFAQSRTQILSSNLYCEVDSLGPHILLLSSNGQYQQLSIAQAKKAVTTKLTTFSRQIKAIKFAIKRRSNVAKNKKKFEQIKAQVLFWQQVALEIQVCSTRLPNLVNPTPVPTSTPGGGIPAVIPIAGYSLLNGGEIIASDYQFLGAFSNNRFSSESIANSFGPYGSDFSSTSIFNDFGPYGSDFSSKSPWNQFASSPPIIAVGGVGVAFLTANQLKTPRVDPFDMLLWLGRGR